MNDAKYIGLDVHQATISATVLDSAGRLVMESILETKATTILQFIHGLRGDLQVTFEEGTCAAWLHDLLKPHVTRVLVCDPRKNALLKVGNKSDRIDARKLAELLRSNLLRPVFHDDTGLRKASEEQIAQSLEGNWQEDLLFVLQQEQDGYEFCQKQMAECDHQLAQYLQQRENRSQSAHLSQEKRKG